MGIPISLEDPIYIVVEDDGSWNAYSTRKEPTPRDCHLFALLTEMGGINETVTPGTWWFNMAILDNNTCVVALEPVPEGSTPSRIFHRF